MVERKTWHWLSRLHSPTASAIEVDDGWQMEVRDASNITTARESTELLPGSQSGTIVDAEAEAGSVRVSPGDSGATLSPGTQRSVRGRNAQSGDATLSPGDSGATLIPGHSDSLHRATPTRCTGPLRLAASIRPTRLPEKSLLPPTQNRSHPLSPSAVSVQQSKPASFRTNHVDREACLFDLFASPTPQ
ncbi:hypothetical protein E2P81_ATG02882 [Venturia nashicola]|nr:hypothetical protein E2P81_ATG02882 [Venturia nashicola]